MEGKMPVFPADLPTIRWRHWLLAAFIALLFHALFLFPKLPFTVDPSALAPPRIDVKQVDPRKLEAIRKQWRNSEKQLLIDKNKAPHVATEDNPDARYMSDRNIRVKKEQRAKIGEVVPKVGAPGAPTAQHPPSRPKAQPKTPPRDQHRLPSLGNLGVPLPVAPKSQPTEVADQSDRSRISHERTGENGGEQNLHDPNVPEGGENLLNAQESVYYSFYARLYEAIGPIWQSKIRTASRMRRIQPGDYSTNLDVVFDKQGNLVKINTVASSGIEEFDQAAFNAWHTVGQFPNPPSGLLNEEGQVHTGWNFTVQVSQAMNLESLPPERVY
jgi:TonB family protein